MLDVGCYPLNILTSILGPVRAVRGSAKITIPRRTIGSGDSKGKAFTVTTPDHVNGLLEFTNGIIGRLSTSFVVGQSIHTGIEMTGTLGTLRIESPWEFNAKVSFYPIGENGWKTLPPVAHPFSGTEWSRGVLDMADAIRSGKLEVQDFIKALDASKETI